MTTPDDVVDVDTMRGLLDGVDYLADLGLATAALFCALRLPQPLLLEGEAGLGKTEAAKALAAMLDTPLVRLQCYEGIDAAEALYEWNYPRQLLGIRLAEATGREVTEHDLFGPSTWSSGRCSGRSGIPGRGPWCCWSTRSTGPTTSSKPSCWRCWLSRP